MILVLQEMKDEGSLKGPRMRQAAAIQISLYYSTKASLKFLVQNLVLHKHQSFCQDVGSTLNVGAKGTVFGPSAKSQTYHAPFFLAIQSLRWQLSPCLSFFFFLEENRREEKSHKTSTEI